MSTEPPEYTEEQLRALEAELDRVQVDEVLVQTMVSLLNLGARKAGLAAGVGGMDPPQPDREQTRQAIEAVRALIPLVEPRHPDQARAVRDMLSQLQVAYAQLGPGAGAEAAAPGGGAPQPAGPAQPGGGAGQPGEAQRSGRLWVPGQ